MVKKVKKFNHASNLKKKWKKMKAKSNPKVNFEQVKAFWDPKKSLKQNYMDIGLSSDPNQTLHIPKAKTTMKPKLIQMQIDNDEQQQDEITTKKEPSTKMQLLEEAAKQTTKVQHNLNENDVLYCIYFIEKYKDDYVKMAKDYKNYYQDTPKQLKRRIEKFKQMSNHYKKYLQDKKDGISFLNIEEKI
jgi:hypothetical protein